MAVERTREPQYQVQVDLRDAQGLSQLGLVTNQLWHDDPRHMGFLLARYKFVAKMLSGKKKVLEVGCGDAFGTRMVQQEVGAVWAVDFDPVFVDDVNRRMDERWRFECRTHDIVQGPFPGQFDAAYSLDVIEHIVHADEERFLANIAASLEAPGVLIIGTPSLESQAHATPASKAGHINCKDAPGLKTLLQRFFQEVFVFSMNDEVVHTGYYPMAHYLFAVCVGKRPV